MRPTPRHDVDGTLAVNNATLDAVITQFRTDVGDEIRHGLFSRSYTSASWRRVISLTGISKFVELTFKQKMEGVG